MSKTNKYKGVVVPMVTPATEDGRIDKPAVERVIEHLISGGMHGIFVLGTTGEAQSVPADCRIDLVRLAVGCAKGRATVYAGISDNCLKASIEAAKLYFDAGVDAVVAHLPCYYPIEPENMLRYYENLAAAIDGPLMTYNITITTHMSIPLDVVDTLSAHPNIIGLKDSEKDPERMKRGASMWRDRRDFVHMCGSAVLSAEALLAGSDGIVPSTGNFAPDPYRRLYDAAISGDTETAAGLQEETNELSKVYQSGRKLGTSLAALKCVMNHMNLCGEAVFPPLLKLTPEEKDKVFRQLEESRGN